ncbi:bifunctional metallophosphatase/5'-nucleotidase [Altererythrobacter sp. B11]|uniref:bifunctional metallophosphatase/5'-nucleotidase n=1 Tax=Altererythrobacter sp. B11 TaxID=2060312 RepID=UPI000DC73712|nr:bifunctional metallophosphatase/5'-nucleotidase [Altererythrobacter sp. B11]BBC72827.1 bifunctional metallophosphatase/5'-nucleotidase [Altererythrobacter sp. B11]
MDRAARSLRHLLAAILAAASLSACTTVTEVPSSPVTVQILALNDFHGNLAPPGEVSWTDGGEERRSELGGVARIGATLAGLRQGHPNTVTVAAGDMIGASPLASGHFLDEPSIAALNSIGLDVTSVGNHEFDRGVPELRRMQQGGCEQYTERQPCALEPFAGAHFPYLAGNTVDAAGESVFPGTFIKQVGPLKIGFIGMTLKDTALLVSPAATHGYRFLDEAPTANRLAVDLRARGADLVVLLIHQGGWAKPPFSADGCADLSGDILPILDQLDPSIQLVISGHTHNTYICRMAGEGGGERLLTSAGRYGYFVTDIELKVDPQTRQLLSLEAHNVPVTAAAGEQADTAEIARRYLEAAKPVAERVIGHLALTEQPEDCADSWEADLIADAQLAAAADPARGSAEIAFMNSGGVRGGGIVPGESGAITYGQIFTVQPFGSAIEVLELSGEQLQDLLEDQFCDGQGGTAICYSTLVPSAGFAYSYDLSRPKGERVVSLSFRGAPIDPRRVYRVATGSFLANGGDGFRTFTQGKVVSEAGIDLDALSSYLANGVQAPSCGRVRQLD